MSSSAAAASSGDFIVPDGADAALTRDCINTVRVLSADTVQRANSGHPGAPMGCAPMAHTLFTRHIRFDASQPQWFNRDRFVLSNGHASALQYTLLHLCGYDMPVEQLMRFRQLDSTTPGHPEVGLTAGVEVSTGPLGQGLSNAVGLAIAEANLAATFNRGAHRVVDHFTYVICGDGCLQEGVTSEACSLAGHLRLGKLIVLYDDNHITIDGDTALSFGEDVLARYAAYGWHVQTVADGDRDLRAIEEAIVAARAETHRPSIIKVRTTIGFGSAAAGSEKVHGAPLGAADLRAVKARFGFDPDASFVVPPAVRDAFAAASARGAAARTEWQAALDAYAAEFPDLAAELRRRIAGELPAGWKDALPRFSPTDKALATRDSSNIVLNAVARALPELIGGSADLTDSNKTHIKGSTDFAPSTPHGKYVRFGVREHAMAAISNGIAAHGGLLPFCATFFNFIGYALGAVRLSALSHFRVIYIMTHDSIGLGEDGPTHQPIETLASVRAMPNMVTFRPADCNEVSGAYAYAVARSHGPTTIVLTRQALPNLPTSTPEKVALGAYVVADYAPAEAAGAAGAAAAPAAADGAVQPQVVLVASGSEVGFCVDAAKALQAVGVASRVVSMPCFELFAAQSAEYRMSVIPRGVPTLSVECASAFGWDKFSHAQIAMTTFGKSAPGPELFKHFGFSPAAIADKARKLVDFYAGRSPPDLYDRPLL